MNACELMVEVEENCKEVKDGCDKEFICKKISKKFECEKCEKT